MSYTKALLLVGKTEGNTALVRIIKVECFERIVLGNLAIFLKILFKKIPPDGLQIYEQVSIALRTVLTLNNPRQGDGY